MPTYGTFGQVVPTGSQLYPIMVGGGNQPFGGQTTGQNSPQSWDLAQVSQSPYVQGMISGGAFGGPNWLAQQGTPQSSTNMPTLPNLGSPTGQGGGYAPGAAPDIGSLTQMINQLNLQGQQAANQGRIPGAAGLEAASSGNIANLLAGQVPPDVQRQIAQTAAERGISTGNDNLLQSLGLTSLGLQQTGQQNLSQAYARNPVAPLFDPTTQTMTPAQAAQANLASQQLMLEWYKALTANNRANQGRQQSQPTDTGTAPAPVSWFPSAGGTPGPVAPPPSSYGSYGTVLSTNPTGVGYDMPNPYGTGYSSPSPGMGFPFTGLSGVGYDQGLGNYGYGVGYDPTQFNPTEPGGLFGGPPSVGYDQGQGGNNFGVGYDQTTYDPFSGYSGS